MSDLVEFLQARIDEDECTARAAIADDGGQDGGFEGASWLTDGTKLPRFGDAAGEMIRTFAVPARVLREVEAKRQIIASCEEAVRRDEHAMAKTLAVLVLEDMALPYAAHQDYRPEWKPQIS